MFKADLLLTNANVLTLDEDNTRACSLAVTNGRISGVWPDAEPPKNEVETGADTEVVNLNGATLIPGFIDTHNHILMYAQSRKKVNCSTPPNQSISDILKSLGNKIIEKPNGEWVEGYGYDDTLLDEKRHPTRDELDKISPNNPVVIRHISGHLAAVNSLALKYAGLKEGVADPKGGSFGRDSQGRLNGMLYEASAMKPVFSQMPMPTVKEMVTALGEASKDYLAQGITTNSDAAVGMHLGIKELDAHLKAAKQGVNPMRTQLMVMHNLLREGEVFGDYSAELLDQEIRDRSKGFVRLDSAKMFQDGSIQGLTGALRKPYYKNPEILGDLIFEQEPFQEEILDLHKRGYRVTIHGNGDRAIGSILDAYEYALTESPRKDHRHRIEHVQTGTPWDLDKMKELDVAGSFFINHVYYWGDRHERLFLGPERARRISPLADAVDRDLLFTLHSDCPVTPISPLFSVWAAVNRLTSDGNVLGPEQCCDVTTALKSMTIFGAKLNFDEENTGSIELGKCADFAVLEEDPTKVDSVYIKDISVLMTFIDGKIVYEEKGSSLIK
ncbi:amidohydrolase [Halobacillus shinanisalinarum]|uniref:Amidohydrolase n=1 Tax=Halobacillus shinanisalinarum TaxID=2932258 RepID=A0ABY4H821_9BACI|nr:amidohydrolase [Halobacillus shinanisalinarum]UOQ95122.1 amidohydrolase [Halobacillus shinanisalinarum]